MGETRCDGTFYGGAAAMKVLANFNAFLWASTNAALKSGSHSPDAPRCFEITLQNGVMDAMASSF